MGTQRFNAAALDQLLTDAVSSTAQIHQQLMQQRTNDQLIQQSPVSPQISNMVNQKNGLTVDYSRVYCQLQKLIQNGNIALQVLGAVDPDVSGIQVASSTAALMNAIKNCVAQFTKIHMQHIKFQTDIQLLNIKHQHRMRQLQVKKQIAQAKARGNAINNGNVINVQSDSSQMNTGGTTMVPWQTQGINQYVQFLNSKK